MQEFSTLALVLSVEPAGEADARVFLFTEALGQVVARAKSLRKPNSKLAAHLQPLMLSHVRLVVRRGAQVVDALAVRSLRQAEAKKRTDVELLGIARLIQELTSEYHPDEALWRLVSGDKLASRSMLTLLGFDPTHARCERCGALHPTHFLLRNATYLCRNCLYAGAQQLAV